MDDEDDESGEGERAGGEGAPGDGLTWCSSVGLQVSEVRMVRMMKVVKVNPQAERVPRGMDLAGDSSSPDRFAPAMIPSKRHTGINEIVELFIRNVGTIT